MTYRNMKDYMQSGELQNIKLDGNIDFNGIQPDDDGMFVRITGDGLLYPFRVKNQDKEWAASSTADVTLADTETQIIELTVDDTVTQENGSFLFVCKIDNGSSSASDIVPS